MSHSKDNENNVHFCAQCLEDILSIPNATGYCKQCREYICSDACLRRHAKFRLSRNHAYILDDDFKVFVSHIFNKDQVSEQADHQTTTDSPSRMKAVLRTELQTRVGIDKEICSIHATSMVSDGNIVLADIKNNNLKLFSSEKRICISVLKLENGPRDICTSNKSITNLYAIEKGVSGIYTISTKGGALNIEGTLDTEGECFGIACWKNGIAVTMNVRSSFYGNTELRLLDYQGRVKRKCTPEKTKSLKLNLPWYLSSNCDGQHILVSDFGNHTLTCLDVDKATVVFVYKDDTLIRPVAVATDSNCDIFVTSQRGHCVHHISKDGVKKGVIFSEQMEFPGGISFDLSHPERFYLQCIGCSDTIQVFDLVNYSMDEKH